MVGSGVGGDWAWGGWWMGLGWVVVESGVGSIVNSLLYLFCCSIFFQEGRTVC